MQFLNSENKEKKSKLFQIRREKQTNEPSALERESTR